MGFGVGGPGLSNSWRFVCVSGGGSKTRFFEVRVLEVSGFADSRHGQLWVSRSMGSISSGTRLGFTRPQILATLDCPCGVNHSCPQKAH